MNMDSSMCASSGKANPWEQSDWPQRERNVQQAASAYRQGHTGGSLGQSESFATAANLLVFRQSLGRKAGDGQSRQTNARGGWNHLANSGVQTPSHRLTAAARLSAAAVAACSHSKSQWEIATAGHPDDERPRHAGIASAGVGTRRRDHGGQPFLWLSVWPKHG